MTEVFKHSLQRWPQVEAFQEVNRELPTPALLIHTGIVRDNIDRYARLARGSGVTLRPHAKTHKSALLADWQSQAGAVGLTVGTVEEAEYFLAAGQSDFFVACPPVGTARQQALASLASRADVVVSVDSAETVAALDAVGRSAGCAIRYYWEVDTGFARYGTAAGSATVDAVLDAQRYDHATFAGLMNFGGSAYTVDDPADVALVSRAEAEQTVETAELIRERGLDVPQISVGSTPSATSVVGVGGVTELRVGTYIFNDATQIALGAAELEDCAQTILATVMSTPSDGRIVIDAGSKAIPKETMTHLTTGFGIVLGYPDLVVERVSEEASVLTWAAEEHVDPPVVGEQLQVVSNHCCSATYLFSHFWLLDDDRLDRQPIGARTR